MLKLRQIGVAGAVMLLSGSASAFAEEPAIAAGRKFAERVCSPCHVVSREDPSPPMLKNSGPSFPDIAGRPDFSAAWLRDFLKSDHIRLGAHAAMPNPAVLDYQIDELVDYFVSLRPRN